MQRLTAREKEVANLVMEGLTNKEIASRLFISVHTVKANLENIYYKLNISSRVLLALFVYQATKKEVK